MRPKHLWSGDWRRESELAGAPRPPTSAAPVADESTPSHGAESLVGRSRWQWERTSALIVIAVLVLAGAVWAIGSIASSASPGSANGAAHQRSTSIGSSTGTGSSTSSGVATVPATPTPKSSAQVPARSHSPADALGLELERAPGDRVIVKAVVAGSPVSSVGIGAGDDLLTINGQHATSPGQVNAILAKLPLGTLVTLRLNHGSEQITAQIQESGIP